MATVTIIDAPRFDLAVTESPDYRGEPRYLVRYGLETKRRDTLAEAMHEFQLCLFHALDTEGLTLDA